ncbi:HK97 family phage prohead protease [Planctomycetota bacterium]
MFLPFITTTGIPSRPAQIKTYSPFEGLDLTVDPSGREFVAKITTFGPDRDNEIIDPRGIDFKNYRANGIVLWNHQGLEPPVGKTIWIKPLSQNREPVGWIAKIAVAEGTARAEEVFRLLQQKVLRTVSIGFRPISGRKPTAAEKRKNPSWRDVVYIHTKIEFLEISIVNVPSNPSAVVLAVSEGTLDISDDMQKDLGLYARIKSARGVVNYPAQTTKPIQVAEEIPAFEPIETKKHKTKAEREAELAEIAREQFEINILGKV